MNKKANILTENVIFIILNLLFLSILIGFLVLQGGGKIVLEKNYAKQIALLIDSSYTYDQNDKIEIVINMEKALKEKDEDFSFDRVVSITGNEVKFKLSEKSEAKYYFFNDVNVAARPLNDKEYVIVIAVKEGENNAD
ncbi:MAG: hypothetical protein AABY22_19470 [Nanoarchaeota archaeon]